LKKIQTIQENYSEPSENSNKNHENYSDASKIEENPNNSGKL
jgi:hypothetical protein